MNTGIKPLFSQNSLLTARAVQQTLTKILKENIRLASEEIRPITLILLEDILKIGKIQLLIDSPLPMFSDEKIQLLENALERLSAEEPIQYITEKATFRDLSLKVNNSVLIPRPETEELVELIIQKKSSEAVQNIIDLGTGSACIALALARHFKNAEVWAIDLSVQALEVAKHNIEQHNANIKLIQADILELHSDKFPVFSLIVSNPPYVTVAEKKQMRSNVLNYEPKEALFVENDAPLRYYESIAKFAQHHLALGGSLWVEINEQYGAEIVRLFEKHQFDFVKLHQDLQQRDRFVSAVLS